MPAKHQIAPLSILAQQLHAVALEIERMPNTTPAEQDRRARWENAAITAFNELAGGTHYTRHDDGSVTFRSRSRPRLEHTAGQDGSCTCEAATEKHIPCWHLPALWMLDGCEEATATTAEPLAPADDNALYHCPRCGHTLYLRNEDDPSTAIYLCCNPRCAFQSARDWFEIHAERPQPATIEIPARRPVETRYA